MDMFWFGLLVGLICGVLYTSLANNGTISSLKEEIRVLNEIDINKSEEAFIGLTEDEMETLNEMIDGRN